MIRRTLLLLAAAVMAVLLAGCDVITHPLQDKVQDKVQNPVSPVSEDAIVVQRTAVLPEEVSISSGGVTTYTATYTVDPTPDTFIYVIDQDGTNEARSIQAAENKAGAVLSPDGEKIAFLKGSETPPLPTST